MSRTICRLIEQEWAEEWTEPEQTTEARLAWRAAGSTQLIDMLGLKHMCAVYCSRGSVYYYLDQLGESPILCTTLQRSAG